MALCLANLVMTALLIFTILPTTKKTDALITQVASVIELELTGYNDNSYKATDVESYKIVEALTKNLKPGEDGKTHFAVSEYVSLSVNKNSEDYKTYNENLLANAYDSKIMDIVGSVISQYTYEDILVNEEEVRSTILSEIKKYFGTSDYIVDVTLGNLVYQ